ncbi:STM4504/CBY_0614 family protein [Adhaeribacter soli]|uniref:Abortive infection family protein n=1 Tax=Adhaeribacter soli TaxID=2607655 RepID=A0A5N1IIE1_9BACT|nr:hypothetical protein [Adhaeribacter soli]KAA9325049.1 hypothetical protein F0P94_19280 [Adhaeribacter soli]
MEYVPYSLRNKPAIDVYSYEPIPQKFKNQFIKIVKGFLYSTDFSGSSNKFFSNIYHQILDYHGLKSLPSAGYLEDTSDRIEQYLDSLEEITLVLDVIEICCREIYWAANWHFETNFYSTVPAKAQEGIDKINSRFSQNGLGYEFINEEIIKIDSQILHAEIVKPVLHFIHNADFKAVDEEYRLAFEHFRHGNFPDCLTNCGKAFESTLKIILTKKGWEFDPVRDTAKKLITICFEKELIPKYLQQHYTSLISALESGVPTIRNKDGGHGAGAEQKVIPEYFTSYMLHLTGTSIKLFTDAYQAHKTL